MKIIADIGRITYANENIEIEIPDSEIPRNKNGKINRKKLDKMVEKKAIEDAIMGLVVFSEHDADYKFDGYEIIEDVPHKKE